METHLKIVGSLMIFLSLIHVGFPGYFKWREEFRTVSLINRQMMYIHTLFIAVTLLLMGALCIAATQGLLQTPLGHTVCLGFAVFWFLRLIVQFWGYSSQLWRGKTFETIIHLLFSCLWIYFVFVFGCIAFGCGDGLFS